jgi:hypothetical protein
MRPRPIVAAAPVGQEGPARDWSAVGCIPRLAGPSS